MIQAKLVCPARSTYDGVNTADALLEDRPVQKKGRNVRKPILISLPLVILVAVLSLLMWYVNREALVRELPYGGLMQIVKADDPGVRFQNVAVRHNIEIRGDMV